MKTKCISKNCNNKNEGHEFCWDKDCECNCHTFKAEGDIERQEVLDNTEVKEIEKAVFDLSDLFLKIYE